MFGVTSHWLYDIRIIRPNGVVFEVTIRAKNSNEARQMAEAQYAGCTACVLNERWPD